MHSTSIEISRVEANGIEVQVATAGAGPPVLLLHGFPHTWELWRTVMPALAASHRVIAPDLRGIGGTTRAAEGYDLHTLADDAAGLLDALGEPRASVVGIDAGTPVAWMLAMRHADRIARLVVMEGLLGPLPGAEAFLAGGPPWWFGFHSVPGLAETVLEGHEAEYLDFFLTGSTAGRRGIDPDTQAAFARAYTGRDALRCAFELYRAFPVNGEQVHAAVTRGRTTVPTMAVGGGVVGDALHRQLEPIADDLVGHLVPDCGHIIPQEQPEALLELLVPFLAG